MAQRREGIKKPGWDNSLAGLFLSGAAAARNDYEAEAQRHDVPLDGSRLDSISVPVPAGGSRRTYVFDYAIDNTGAERVTKIHAPNTGATDRVTSFVTQAGAITQIRYLASTDPLSSTVGFTYKPDVSQTSVIARRIVTRTDRALHTAYFDFDVAGGLARARLDMGSPADDIVHGFCPIETRGMTACSTAPELLTNTSTTWDGPRTDVADTTRFFLNRFGAPTKIRDAMGRETTIDYDPTFPLLLSAVVAPNGQRTTATYTARGLPDVVRAIDPVDIGQDAITRYHYHVKWDLADTVTGPTGAQTVTGFEPTNTWPSVVWQQDGRGALSRATFTYNTARQLILVTPPGTPATKGTQLAYDTLGNLKKTTSAIGFVTTHERDLLGRDTLTVAPTDSAQTATLVTKTRTTYDPYGAVISSWTIGAPTSFTLGLAGGATIAVPAIQAR